MSFRTKILSSCMPIIKFIGRLHAPLSERKVKEENVEEIKKYLKAGDILLSYNRAQLTNLFIKGQWKHAAIYVPYGEDNEPVLEAVSPRVKLSGLYDFMMSKDKISVMRYKDSDETSLMKVIYIARKQVFKEYDYMFKLDSANRFYCSELIYYIFKNSMLDFNFELRKSWGEPTVTPTDFYLAKNYFDLVYEC